MHRIPQFSLSLEQENFGLSKVFDVLVGIKSSSQNSLMIDWISSGWRKEKTSWKLSENKIAIQINREEGGMLGSPVSREVPIPVINCPAGSLVKTLNLLLVRNDWSPEPWDIVPGVWGHFARRWPEQAAVCWCLRPRGRAVSDSSCWDYECHQLPMARMVDGAGWIVKRERKKRVVNGEEGRMVRVVWCPLPQSLLLSMCHHVSQDGGRKEAVEMIPGSPGFKWIHHLHLVV